MLRVGVVGLGFAGQQHLRGYAARDDVSIAALAGLEPDRLRELAGTHRIGRTSDVWEPVVHATDVDAVSVCVPNALHAPIAIAALESGKHVLCEKPLARTGDEAQRIHDAAVAADRVLHVAFNYRARGDVTVLKRLVDEGFFGRIYHVKASWMRRAGIPGTGSWFSSRELAGGGPLIDLGVHVLDVALHLLGERRVVSATAATSDELGSRGVGFAKSGKFGEGHAFDVEDMATALLRLDDGATVALDTAWATHSAASDDISVTVYGSHGGAEMKVVNYAWKDTLRTFRTVGAEPVDETPDVPRGEGHVKVVRDFVEAVSGGDWDAHRGADGVVRARVIDACYASARERREVRLSH